MFYREYRPGSPLSDFVALLWYCRDYNVVHQRERILPSGCIEIVIDLHGDLPPLISGVHSESMIISTSELHDMIGVHFRPGGARPFLRMPAGEFADQDVNLDDICPAGARGLRQRLLEQPGAGAKFQVLEAYLLDRAAGRFDRNPAVSYALAEFDNVPHVRTIAAVTARTGLSSKRFIDVFRDEVGVTPKLFCRIRRFQEVLGRVHRRRRVCWADLAVSCGYFDQAHFVRDFQAFSGVNPTEYLGKSGEWRNHLPLAD
jgi:AraC-like DNA-binding protein